MAHPFCRTIEEDEAFAMFIRTYSRKGLTDESWRWILIYEGLKVERKEARRLRAKAQRRTDSPNIDPEIEAEELRVKLQRHRQRHQARLQRKWDNQKESARIAHEEHRARMRQMQEEHQARMRKMEEDHQADMKRYKEQMKVQLQELERLEMLQHEQILQTNEAIFRLEDEAQNSEP
ncbi:hypothetical protein MMC31_001460 [Peltigera leucophlebia]|nr:hypothetical protein [Peltigera leucophlebia]